jgi:ATP-dependent Lhr-like helicase
VREKFGIDAQVVSSDDGIVLRLADAVDDAGEEVTVAVEDLVLDPGEVASVVTGELGGSALFAARFR